MDRARHTDHLFHTRVVRRDLRVRNRPVHIEAVERSSLEVDLAHSRAGPAPEVRFAAHCVGARPCPPGSLRGGVGNIVFPRVGRDVFVVHVADTYSAPRGRVQAAKLHIVRQAMLAKVLGRVKLPAGVQRTYLQARFAQRLDRHAASRACADHNDVVGLQCGAPSVIIRRARGCRGACSPATLRKT